MKPHYKTLTTALAAALQLAAIAAVPVAWTNSPGMPPYPIKPVPHGSTVDLAVTLKGYTTPPIADGADVRLWYQTNGMGQAWWSAPATFDGNTITASFGPAQDCGADRVSLFFGAPSNVFASAVLRLTHAPGFAPASLPLPTPVLDFGAVELRNLHALTNGWSFGGEPGDYETVSNRAMFAVATNRYGKATVGLWDFPAGLAVGEANDGFRSFLYPVSGGLDVNARDQAETIYHFGFDGVQTDDDVLRRKDLPAPPDLSGYATLYSVNAVSNLAATAASDASTALRVVLGERVWFVVTNHIRTAKGVIPSLQLWEVRDSVTNLVYDSREEITNTVKALTRELHTELTNRIHDVEKTIPAKAWGNYQSDGTDNPEPGKVAIVNQPTVILTGGGTFNKYLEVGNSSVWVLKSSGLCSFGGDTNGNFFAVLDDEGKTHFKVSKTDSFDVDAIINGIFPRQAQNSVLLYVVSTNRQGQVYASPPVLSASTNLQETVWHEEVDGEVDPLGLSVSWERDDAISAWVATITPDTYPPALFLKAKVKQEGGVSVINTAPVRFDGGIQLGNGKYRLVPYTTGGKTYLTVEDLQ